MPTNKMTGSVVIMMLQHLSLKYGRERGGGQIMLHIHESLC